MRTLFQWSDWDPPRRFRRPFRKRDHVRLRVAHRRRAARDLQRDARRRRRVDPSRDTKLLDGMKPTIVRVGGRDSSSRRTIPFDEVAPARPDAADRQTRVVQNGVDGIMTLTYKPRSENGRRGVAGRAPKVPDGRRRPRDHRHTARRPTGTGTRLAECESGGRWDTVDSGPDGYDGGLGIFRQTWRAFGGLEFRPTRSGHASSRSSWAAHLRDLGWDPWGCANNVLHWQEWIM